MIFATAWYCMGARSVRPENRIAAGAVCRDFADLRQQKNKF